MHIKWLITTAFFLFFLPHAESAFFEKLYQGFNKSDQIEELESERKLQFNNFNIELNQFDWTLDLGGSYVDSSLQGLFAFQSQQTISTTYQVGLNKSSFRYGTFSVNHSQTKYDLSNWVGNTLSTFSSDVVYESRNSLNYSYEILNEFRRLEEKEILARKRLETSIQTISEEQSHYDFFVTYVNAKMRILLDQLTNETKVRALKRVSLINKRVRDGLSRTVDLNTAKLSALTQDENLLQNEATLRESLAILEDILKISIPKNSYGQVTWTFKQPQNFPYLFNKSTYPELRRIEALNDVANLNLLKMDSQKSHSLTLDLGYTINSVQDSRQEAVSNTFGSGDTDEKSITLKYSIPLGMETNTLIKTQSKLEQKRNELRLKNKKSELRVLSRVLAENIERYAKAIKILDQKVDLATKIMDENQLLYNRNKVSFEEALRSEENLISTKINRVNMYALYEGALARKAFIEGKIFTFLKDYRD